MSVDIASSRVLLFSNVGFVLSLGSCHFWERRFFFLMHSVSQEAGSSWLKLAQAGSRLIHWAEIQEGAAFFDAFS